MGRISYHPGKTIDRKKEFQKLFEHTALHKNRFEVFQDYLECSAFALASPFHREVHEDLLKVKSKYSDEEYARFDRMFTLMVDIMEEEPTDFLGEAFMVNELGNANKGQFFTPFNISTAMAHMTLGSVKPDVEKNGFMTVSDPCSGAGGMLIAVRNLFLQEGLNPSTHMYAVAQDIDYTAWLMTYIQTSLYGIPAKVILGDTIKMEERRVLYTPIYYICNWEIRLFLRFNKPSEIPEPEEAAQTAQILELPPKPTESKPKQRRKKQQIEFDFDLAVNE